MAEKPKPRSGEFLKNLGKTINLAWQADKKTVLIFVFLTLTAAAVPVGISYSSRFLIDELIRVQGTTGIITVALLTFFGFRYVLDLIDDLQGTTLYQYIDRIRRYRVQNYITYQFTDKVANLDIAHFEDSKTQDLIQRASDSFYYRIPDSIGLMFYALYAVFAFIGSFLVLIPFGFWLPGIMALATIPRFILFWKTNKAKWNGRFLTPPPQSQKISLT